jgi:hypothetical protein
VVHTPAAANSRTSRGQPQARQHKETVMNPIRAIRRLACTLAGVAVAFAATVPAALASASPGQARALSWADPPLPPGWNKHPPLPVSTQPALRYPPGWNKHPPLPAHAHALATGGMPGWQITLVVAAMVLAAAIVVLLARVRAARRRTVASPT